MKKIIKKIVIIFLQITQFIFVPVSILFLLLFKLMRIAGYEKFKFAKKIFLMTGVFPIIDHYYEPLSKGKVTGYKVRQRNLMAIDFNEQEQIDFLNNFHYQDELIKIPFKKEKEQGFFYDNINFPPGDSEYYYSLIRHLKPEKIIEIGSGFSTLLALESLNKNKEENENYSCHFTCIEPYEFKWLKNKGVMFIESIVEDVNPKVFQTLKKNDIIFIDSSHIIKPDGDLLYIFMEILPALNSGVFIHFHDIFTPRDYPEFWMKEKILFWNEQYMLESFLSYNEKFKVIGSLNYLKHFHRDRIMHFFPVLSKNPDREPGSFWIIKK